MSKKQSLVEAREAYRSAFPPGELEMFREDPIDRVGVPAVAASLRLKTGTQFATHGYGATLEEAEVGALGEMAEAVFTDAALRAHPRVTGSYNELVRHHGESAVMNPLRLCLTAGSHYDADMPLTWVTVKRLLTGERVLIPEEWVATWGGELRGRSPLITPITNGQGAGLTQEQALAHGILELLQRDGNGLQFRALDQGVVLDLTNAPLGHDVRDLLARYQSLGIEVIPKLASTDFGLVSVYVVGRDPYLNDQPMALTACGEAADLDRERALRKALLEYAGSRTRKAFANGPLELAARIVPPGYFDRFLPYIKLEDEEPRALHAMAFWARLSAPQMRALIEKPVLSEKRRVPFTDLPTSGPLGDAKDRAALLVNKLTQAGFDILVADLSPSDHSVHSVKVIVPGLEVESMSYHRIGERGIAKLLAREDPLAGHGKAPEGARPVLLTPEAEERLGGPVWFNTRLAEQLVGRLYSLYREPERHAAQLLLRQPRFGGGLG
ncbi:YcaO-like family protein [Archangium primigenium]|uniref:YcaO-like family protein n=1 Tax=[Archangium] primigenium TaxID=2792470 RepID=UPI001956C209|nr:YcaO-like family protein [Archangium primigenium]MBM7113573.1 YcaO-like family protein [Archangium primigenium]